MTAAAEQAEQKERPCVRLYLEGHALEYEMQALCFAFFPGRRVESVRVENRSLPAAPEGDFVWTRLRGRGERLSALCCVRAGGRTARAGCRVDFAGAEAEQRAARRAGMLFDREREGSEEKTAAARAEQTRKKACELALGRAFYRAASRAAEVRPPWGILTGIRPVKLARMWLSAGKTPEETRELFEREYRVSPAKARLCLATASAEQRIVDLSRPESASFYFGIPFCPTRCLYCSFISQDVEKAARLVPDYVRLLCEEIAATGETAKRLGLRIETVYMGGGTPTALSAEQLGQVLGAVNASFDLSHLREFTVEAGRPDTITREKLDAILAGGARRISINPQTLDDTVLRRIGRAHTAADVYRAFALARRAGVPCINMDLIAGLPGDSPEGFAHTLDAVLELSPEAVTVHTLAMKRASRLVTEWGGLWDAAGESVSGMLDTAAARLQAAGYAPYYLYRQKNTLGGLENVGFARPGSEGLYNVFIMDETHSVLAAGAGGVTKLRQPFGGRIERCFNFKYPYEYISRFGEILQRKKKVDEFYGEFPWNRDEGKGKD